jgi:uncharacterized glyoxalase superfamily protein PhnB
MTTTIRRLTPVLETKNIRDTIAFYTNNLQFTCDRYVEQWGWSQLSKDGCSIMFTIPNEHRHFAEPIMSGSLYMTVDDVEGIWQSVKDICKVCYPLEVFEYGMKEFAIYDNNGYLLQFGQEVN